MRRLDLEVLDVSLYHERHWQMSVEPPSQKIHSFRATGYETWRLVTKIKVSGQQENSEVRSMTQKSRFGFLLITPSTVAVEPKFKHHSKPPIKTRRMTYFCLVEVKFNADPEVKVMLNSLRSWIEIGVKLHVRPFRRSVSSQWCLSRLPISIWSEVVD